MCGVVVAMVVVVVESIENRLRSPVFYLTLVKQGQQTLTYLGRLCALLQIKTYFCNFKSSARLRHVKATAVRLVNSA